MRAGQELYVSRYRVAYWARNDPVCLPVRCTANPVRESWGSGFPSCVAGLDILLFFGVDLYFWVMADE